MKGSFWMDAKEFGALLGSVGRLSSEQQETLRHLLSLSGPTAADLLEGRQEAAPRCPHCDSSKVGKWGRAHGLRRYRCQECGRSFNALTNTPLARLRHKAKWLTFTAALKDAVSVRKAAEHCGVATTTSFRWRHRFLAAPAEEKPAQLSGIVEADETFFRRSFKGSRQWTRPQPGAARPSRRARKRGAPTGRRGTPLDEFVPVLVARDRQKLTSDAILDGLSAQAIGKHLIALLGPGVLLCTDTNAAYGALARSAGIHHEPVNVSKQGHVRERVFHIQNVNAYDSRLKAWMARFNGVATKYLHSYLGWRRMIEALADTANPQSILIRCV